MVDGYVGRLDCNLNDYVGVRIIPGFNDSLFYWDDIWFVPCLCRVNSVAVDINLFGRNYNNYVNDKLDGAEKMIKFNIRRFNYGYF